MKKAKKPNLAIIDGDLLLYPAASSAEKRIYTANTPEGELIGEFESAADYKKWLFECDMFGVDAVFGYTGNLDEVVRDSYIKVGELETAKKNFKSMLNDWLKRAGVDKCEVYISAKQGMRNKRHDKALRKQYKGNRGGTEKPVYLEALRKWAMTLPYVKRANASGFECDDVVCAKSQKQPKGARTILIQNEKDGLQCVGCWVFYPDIHDKPVWSCPETVGWVGNVEGVKKVTGLGHLHLLHQVLMGDTADTYSGLDDCGEKTSLKILSKYNHKPIEVLPKVIKEVCQMYKDKYGDEYEYINKDGEEAVASWFDFFEESVCLAYMVKNKVDYPDFIIDVAKEFRDGG